MEFEKVGIPERLELFFGALKAMHSGLIQSTTSETVCHVFVAILEQSSPGYIESCDNFDSLVSHGNILCAWCDSLSSISFHLMPVATRKVHFMLPINQCHSAGGVIE